MSQGPSGYRPGGLTALAVLNFVFGGFGVLGVLAFIAALSFVSTGVSRAGFAVEAAPIMGLVYVAILLSVIQITLLLASGVGYLQQKRFLGKTLGSVYGILGIVNVLVGFLALHVFGIMQIIGLIYPVLTLALLNTVFKDDFPQPVELVIRLRMQSHPAEYRATR